MTKSIKTIKRKVADQLPNPEKRAAIAEQGRRHSAVGVTATVIDIGLLNIIVLLSGLPALTANLISATVSGSLSYALSRRWVFPTDLSKRRTIAAYALVTLVGIYVIQSTVILLVMVYGESIGQFTANILQLLFGISASAEAILLNVAKLLAVAIAGIWNFIMCRRVVFKAHRHE